MRDQFSVVIHDEHRTTTHACILQALQDRPERNHCRQHSRKFVLIQQRNGDHERGHIVRRQCQRVAVKLHRVGLLANLQRSAQHFVYERILFRSKISLRSAGAFSVLADRRHVKKRAAIAFDKIFQQPRHFRLGSGIFHVLNQTGQLQNLLFA